MQKEHLAIASIPVQNWGPLYEEEQALQNGTIFKELNLPFFAVEDMEGSTSQSAEPKSVEQKEREDLLTKILLVGFYLDDLALYLDTHEQDQEAMKLYREKGKERDQLKKEFAEKFYPLTRDCLIYCTENSKFCWQEGPAPWEGACV